MTPPVDMALLKFSIARARSEVSAEVSFAKELTLLRWEAALTFWPDLRVPLV